VATRSKARNVFARSNTGIVDSNPTQGMDVFVRLFCVCVVLFVGNGIATCCSPVQEDLPTVCRIWKLKMRYRPNKRLQSHNNVTQFFIYLRAELNSRWPITESARNIKR
jgi:hypothetical protein